MSWQEGFQFKPPVMERKQCPGDNARSCEVMIPVDRQRCFFCTRTRHLAIVAALAAARGTSAA